VGADDLDPPVHAGTSAKKSIGGSQVASASRDTRSGATICDRANPSNTAASVPIFLKISDEIGDNLGGRLLFVHG